MTAYNQYDFLQMILNCNIYDLCKETNLQHAEALSHKYGVNILLKREDLQPIFSFKLRGAYNKLLNLTIEERNQGIIATSAGSS